MEVIALSVSHRLFSSHVVAVIVALGLSVAVMGPGADVSVAQEPSSQRLREAARARESYGLPASPSRVANLLRSTDNAASTKYGFPLSIAEYHGLMARTAYVKRFQRRTLPFVEELDGYAGAWVDRRGGGRIVVGLTHARATMKSQVRQRLPAQNLGVRFKEVDDSARALARALRRADRVWARLRSGIRPQAFAIRYRQNRVVVKVLKRQLKAAKALAPRFRARLGVDVGFEATGSIRDSTCRTRQKCLNPLRLGARINHPTVYDRRQARKQWSCAVGFMLSNHRILTAGHCTHRHKGPWHGHRKYRARYGKIGKQKSSRYTSGHHDLAIIELENWSANKTTRLFGDTWPTVLTPEDGVIENMDVCVSLARQDKYWCGYVNDAAVKWKSTTANPDIWVWGAGMRFNQPGRTSLPGDSGGPIVYESQECDDCPLLRTPVGIVNAGNEADGRAATNSDLYFAKVEWALNNPDGWPGLSIYTGPVEDG